MVIVDTWRLERATPTPAGRRRIALGPAWLDGNLSLRLAVAEDRKQLFSWHCDAFAAHIEQIWGWDVDWQCSDFTRLVDHVPTFVVVHDARAIGYLQLLPRAQALQLVNIALIEPARGQGVGRRLLDWLKQRATDAALALELGVFVTNPRARAFYERCGLACVETTASHWRMRWTPDAA